MPPITQLQYIFCQFPSLEAGAVLQLAGLSVIHFPSLFIGLPSLGCRLWNKPCSSSSVILPYPSIPASPSQHVSSPGSPQHQPFRLHRKDHRRIYMVFILSLLLLFVFPILVLHSCFSVFLSYSIGFSSQDRRIWHGFEKQSQGSYFGFLLGFFSGFFFNGIHWFYMYNCVC